MIPSFYLGAQQDEFAGLSQHFSGGVFPTNLTVTIAPAARMMMIKSILFKRLPFF
jgi:hypothetical protein